MVSALAKQRDMYRTLLAQSTPLPGDTTTDGKSPPRSSVAPATTTPGYEGSQSVSMVAAATPSFAKEVAMETTTQALTELKEQFATYRREKGQNEAMVGQQMETLRQEASALRMDNVKMAAKVGWSHYTV